MQKIVLELPPSGNVRLMPSKQGRLINTPQYRQWKEAASWSVKTQLKGLEPIDSPVMTIIKLTYKNNRRRDYDNVVKCVNDTLTQGGAIKDDSLIRCALTYCGPADKVNGGKVEIELYPLDSLNGEVLARVQSNLSNMLETLANKG